MDVSSSYTPVVFRDREQAGALLAARLETLHLNRAIAVGLPRGGVPVAAQVARQLGWPLDILVVRKLGVPTHREYAFGALGEDGVRVLDPAIITQEYLSATDIETVELRERAELERRVRYYRAHALARDLRGESVVLIDDGLATGATARAAIAVALRRGATQVIVAIPVASAPAVRLLEQEGVQVVSLSTPDYFVAVGAWYVNFEQCDDSEVLDLLTRYAHSTPG